ncbi:Hypothetical protein HEAR0913 [Herminiimonas arsenicoxydans]|uniref:Hydroxyacylglutathione hydrolase n=1 Tax=Herminiimonas arsenicoxydans TaxID=204773 RepID=A4G3L0_HERAR|nr:Hypothetical protein HEAR0913 [Herminiimonas arsenicoxydans]
MQEKLFTLPDDALVYPAHDYKGRRTSSIARRRSAIHAWAGEKHWKNSGKSWRVSSCAILPSSIMQYRETGSVASVPSSRRPPLVTYCHQITSTPQG